MLRRCWAAARSRGPSTKACWAQRTAPGSRCATRLIKFGLDPDRIGAAARARSELLAYVELHIEQGPVLEGLNLAGRRCDCDRRRDAACGKPDRHGRSCRHGADAAAARCARGCCGMHCRDRGILPDRPGRAGRHRRIHPRHARRDQCHSRAGRLHHRHPRGHGRTPQARGCRYRPASRGNRQAPQAIAATRRHPRKSHRALRALAEAASGGRDRGRRFSRVRTAERGRS